MTLFLLIVLSLGLICAECISRAAAQVGGEPTWLKDLPLQRKDTQMYLSSRSGPVPIVFVGSSAVMCAVDPGLITASTGVRCYNAGIFRGLPSLVAPWTRDFVLRRLKPELVVIEAWPPVLSDVAFFFEEAQAQLSCRWYRWAWPGRAVYELGLRCVSMRMIEWLLKPRQLLATFRKMAAERQVFQIRYPLDMLGTVGAGGESVEYATQTTRFTGPRMREVFVRLTEAYVSGGREHAALESLVRQCQASGARVALVCPPVSDEYLDEVFPQGRSGWEKELAKLMSLAARVNAAWLDVSLQPAAEERFADFVHLNRAGQVAFSSSLAKGLERLSQQPWTHTRSHLEMS